MLKMSTFAILFLVPISRAHLNCVEFTRVVICKEMLVAENPRVPPDQRREELIEIREIEEPRDILEELNNIAFFSPDNAFRVMANDRICTLMVYTYEGPDSINPIRETSYSIMVHNNKIIKETDGVILEGRIDEMEIYTQIQSSVPWIWILSGEHSGISNLKSHVMEGDKPDIETR